MPPRRSQVPFAVGAMLSLVACEPALSPEGERLAVIAAAPGVNCVPLGTVTTRFFAYQRPAVCDGYLVEVATTKARNAAGERGATHFQPTRVRVTGEHASARTAVVTGMAYRCAPGGLL